MQGQNFKNYGTPRKKNATFAMRNDSRCCRTRPQRKPSGLGGSVSSRVAAAFPDPRDEEVLTPSAAEHRRRARECSNIAQHANLTPRTAAIFVQMAKEEFKKAEAKEYEVE